VTLLMTTENAGSQHSLPHHCKLVLNPLPLLSLVHTEETENRSKGQPPLISTEHGRQGAEHSFGEWGEWGAE
jgi:hypothetical protein